MKKLILLTTSVLSLGLVIFTTEPSLTHAATTQISTPSTETKGENDNIILDKGYFSSPMLLDPYNYGNNAIGFNTGKVVLSYTSTSLVDLDETVSKYFNLKLPSEFEQISEMNKGNDLKIAITASYKLPRGTDYITFTPKEIDTSHQGQINFTLPTTALIYAGEITNVRLQVDFGKILDSLDLGPDYNYTQLIPDATSSAYEFKGVLTSHSHFKRFPTGTAIGYTEGDKAIDK